ncbi:MAG: hypothetical protein V3V61_00230 [Gammaproteobacteria bacterium]
MKKIKKSNTQYTRERREWLEKIGFVKARGEHHKDDTPQVHAFLRELNSHRAGYKDRRKKDEIN